MGVLAITMFAGITALALLSHVHMAEDPSALIGCPAGVAQKTALSQIGLATFGNGAFLPAAGLYRRDPRPRRQHRVQRLPRASSLLGRDNYLPRQLALRGDRLVFSNGIVLLAVVAALLIVAFNAEVTRLIQLYILGVFLSFTLSQAGMVRHWARL